MARVTKKRDVHWPSLNQQGPALADVPKLEKGENRMGIFKRGRPSRQEPSDKPGIYFFRNKRTKKVDYVGETKNLKRRKKQHLASKTFKKLDLEVHWFESKEADGRSTSRTRRQHESSKIDRHKPLLNQRRGGGGRKAR
jgi:hypothetical protein